MLAVIEYFCFPNLSGVYISVTFYLENLERATRENSTYKKLWISYSPT